MGLEKAISEEEAKIENNKQNIENHSTEKAETTKRINKLEKKMEKFSEEMTIRKEEIEEIQESIKSIESEEELDKELSDGETDEDEDSEKKEEGMSSSPILNGLHYYEFRETNSVIKTLYSNLTNIQSKHFIFNSLSYYYSLILFLKICNLILNSLLLIIFYLPIRLLSRREMGEIMKVLLLSILYYYLLEFIFIFL